VRLLLVGVSHRTAPLELREQLAIPTRDLPTAVGMLRAACDVGEAVILSTCNRTELYVTAPDSAPALTIERLVDFLAWRSHLAPERVRDSLYRLRGREVVRHLFRVAAGLDSMIVGESEITAQVKQAYLVAQARGATGPLLNQLFQKALHSAKVIRSRTRVAEGQASIGSVVATLAKQLFGGRLHGTQVLLWGAGKAAEATARHLVKGGVGQLWIVNRTQTKARDLASLCEGGWLSWEQALRHLAHVDIAIICTQAPHYVIDQADVEAVRSRRGGRPLFLVDLAVPRNVDPRVAGQPLVHLHNIDDLQTIAQEALASRQQELVPCEALIHEQVGHFWRRWNAQPNKEAVACQLVEA
jgi:glutamyl-tRNA reductase